MLVYVLNKKGKPLMPTTRFKHVKMLLKSGKAVPVCNNPFTIRLKYDTPDVIQPLTCGIDVGRENIGLGVSNQKGECEFYANVQTNNKQVTKNMSNRAMYRRARRSHRRQRQQRRAIRTKTTIQNGDDNILRSKKICKSINISYPGMEESITHKVCKGKEAKFNNRKRPDGWITPSARNLVQIHVNLVKMIQKFLPITHINVENNIFDFQKLENADIENWQYQKGPLYGFESPEEYISKQQGCRCLLCKTNDIKNYHHIIPRSQGGSNTIKNLAGLCDECHDLVHKDNTYTTELSSLKEGIKKQYEIGLLNSCMQLIIDELNNILPVTCCSGYETSKIRKRLSLDKDHSIDAYCISLFNNPDVTTPVIKSEMYKIKHFKKKSNNIIKKIGSRKYYYNGKLVAINRHKAIEQKEPSLEEYMSEYRKTHTEKETNQHFHDLEVKSAKRTYTFHKTGVIAKFKCGDVVKYIKKRKNKTIQKVFIVTGVKQSTRLCYDNYTKEANAKYCALLQGKSLVFV
ncbi:MAG: RRXRR domain-containing protein [Acutalibacteraceae bacterium]|nr:RRXRR domain-containing protein [Acutalibacteraceae bacterium]